MITYGTATIFSSFDKSAKDRLNMRLPEAIEKVSKKEIPKYKRFICVGVSGNTKDGVDFLMPDVRYEIWWLYLNSFITIFTIMDSITLSEFLIQKNKLI